MKIIFSLSFSIADTSLQNFPYSIFSNLVFKHFRRHDSDNSPPRKSIKTEVDSDISPPRNIKTEEDSDISPPRIKQEPEGDLSPPRRGMSKTLDGKKAGLQNAKMLKQELDTHKRKENDSFSKVSTK